jgi:uncharacterized phage protein (TIGR02220 family)
MISAWFAVDVNLRGNPKFIKLRDLVGTKERAVYVLFQLWSATVKYRPHGKFDGMSAEDVADLIGGGIHEDEITALIQSGFMDAEYTVHDWDIFNGRFLDKLKQDRERKLRDYHRGKDKPPEKSKEPPQNLHGSLHGVSKEFPGLPDRTYPNRSDPDRTEPIEEAKIGKPFVGLAPNDPTRKDQIPYDAIVSDYNQITGGAVHATTKEIRKLIKKRWDEGKREADFHAATVYYFQASKLNPTMAEHLHPATIFNGDMWKRLDRTPPAPPLTLAEKIQASIDKLHEKDRLNDAQ